MAEIMAEHLPPGVFNVVCGDRDTGRALVVHDTPAMVSVTGSVRAGMEVAAAAAPTLKRVHLELGGKAPVIVFDDADPAAAAEGIAGAGYFNAGQDCTAATRVLAGAPGARRPAGGAGRAGRGHHRRGHRQRGRRLRAAEQRQPARAGARLPRAHARARVGGDRRDRRWATAATASRRRSSPACARTTRWSNPRCSGRSSPCRSSATRPRRSSGPTAWSTGWPPRCGPVTTAGPCAWRAISTSVACGSTRTSRWWPRCPTAGSSAPGYGKDLSAYGFEDYTRVKHVMSNIEE